MTEPAYSFTIPSIHDRTPLDCRIYQPKSLSPGQHDASSCASIRAAIVAHPYAPLGGCFDDAVVLSVTESLLQEEFIVGTFNFRGAAGSPGSTSLTGKAEQADYESFIGFLITYCRDLLSSLALDGREGNNEKNAQARAEQLDLVLAGYSYGSLVLARLQSISAIATHFHAPVKGSTEAEIIDRAEAVSRDTKQQIESLPGSSEMEGLHVSTPTHGPRASALSVTVGDEQARRQKRERIRHFRKSTGSQHRERHLPSDHERASIPDLPPKNEGNPELHISTRYLMISPVILPFTHSLCPPGSPSIMLSLGRATAASSHRSSYLDHPTLTVFGDSDGFTSNQRLRTWAEKQSQESGSTFEWAEINEAGHFWREDGAMQALQQKVVSWSRSVS